MTVKVGDQGYLCGFSYLSDKMLPAEVIEVGARTFKAKCLRSGKVTVLVKRSGFVYGSGSGSHSTRFEHKSQEMDMRYESQLAKGRCERLAKRLTQMLGVSEETYQAIQALLNSETVLKP